MPGSLFFGLDRPRLLPAAALLALWIAGAELATPWLTARLLGAGAWAEGLLALWTLASSYSTLVALLLFLALSAALASPRFVRTRVGSAAPEALAGIRILTCSVLLVQTLWEDLPSSAAIPRELLRPMGVLEVLRALPTGFEQLIASPPALAVLQGTAVLLLLAGAVGWRTRIVLPAAFAAALLVGGILRMGSHLFHTGLVPLHVLFVLCLGPCADAWSLDRLRRRRAGEPVAEPGRPRPVYGWARYACWVALAVPYLEAGLSKLRAGGLDWLAPESFLGILLQDTLNPMHFDWSLSLHLVRAPGWALTLLAAGAVAGEVFYATVLVSRAARRIFPAFAIALHTGIWLLQNVLFLDLILLQAVFLEPGRRRRRVTDRGAGGRPDQARSDRAPAGDEADAAMRWAPRTRILLVVLLLPWVLSAAQYPLSPWPIYSLADRSGEVRYFEVVAGFASGEVRRAPIEQALGALKDTRYRDHLPACFDEARREHCDALLAAVLERYNRGAGRDPIAWIEVRQRRWSFVEKPGDPERGEVVRRHRFAAPPP